MADNSPSILAGREISVGRPDAALYADDIRHVKSNAELTKALAELSAGKGGIIELASGVDYKLSAVDYQNRQVDAPVLIRSADADKPAVFSAVNISSRENLSLVDVEVHGTRDALGATTNMITIQSSKNVGIYDSEIHSNATGAAGLFDDPSADQTIGSSAVLARASTNVTFAGNKIHDANHGFALLDSKNVSLVGNEITAMQGDGIRIGGVQDLTIQANWIHDMYGSTTSFNHPDMIQFWGANIKQNTVGVTIRDNILDVGTGPSYQMIFGRNEDFNTNGWLFEDIKIENNVLVGGTYHQISIVQTKDAVVRNNTVLTQDDGYSLQKDGTTTSHGTGWIKMGGVNATIEKNIGATVYSNGDNVEYTLGSGTSSTDQDANFVNLSAGASGDVRDLMLRQDSAWNGFYGSDLLWSNGKTANLTAVATTTVNTYNQSAIKLDASLSSDASGMLTDAKAKFLWTFDDGTTRTGRTIEHDFGDSGTHSYSLRVTHSDGRVDTIERSIEIENHTYFDFELVDGKLVNTIEGGSGLLGNAVFSSKGLQIKDGQVASLSRTGEGLTDLDAFNFEMTIEPVKGASGVFIFLNNAIRGEVRSDGSIRYEFTTDDGVFRATTAAGVFDGGPKLLNFVYDGEAKTFGIYVDGDLAAETQASGTTLPMAAWPLSFGRPWGGTLDATVSSIRLSQEARPDEVVETGPSEPEVTEPETGTPRDPHDFGEVYASIDFEGDLPSGARMKQGAMSTDAKGNGVLNLSEGQVIFDRKAGWIYDAEEFDISFDATLLEAGSAGSILHLNETLSVLARSNGSLSFTLTTDNGTKTIVTDANVLEVGQSQRISIGYDSDASIMQISVDGEVLVQGEQSGETPPVKYWGLAIGHTWAKAVPKMAIDNFVASEHTDTRLPGEAPSLETPPVKPVPVSVVDDRVALIDIDFDGDVQNDTENSVISKVSRGDPGFAEVNGRSVAVFDGNDTVSIPRSSALLYNRDSFDFDVSLRTGDGGGGTVMQIHKSLSLRIEGDDFVFRMETDAGQVSVRSNTDVLGDEEFHSVRVGYDADKGLLAMSVDGTVVDSTEAHGSTQAVKYWGMDIGSPWNASLVAEVDHFKMYDAPNWELSA